MNDVVPLEGWGKANSLRGREYHELAIAFLDDFPVGGPAFSIMKFDEWAHRRGLLNVPFGAMKKSDAWLAHLQRRHHLRYNINKAAAHTRMSEAGAEPYIIESVRQDFLEVRPLHRAISENSIGERLESLVKTKRRQLSYLMQSADWEQLPPHERVVAEVIYDDISAFGSRVTFEADQITGKLRRLEARLKLALQRGELKASNGGVAALLEDKEE
jgi:hypothetical protein